MAHGADAHEHPNYVLIWYWLIGLALMSVLLSALPISDAVALFLIFAAACVKAVLVALYFMHLRFERVVIIALLLAPILLFIALLVVVFFDITLQQP